jgi:hypothetical protein
VTAFADLEECISAKKIEGRWGQCKCEQNERHGQRIEIGCYREAKTIKKTMIQIENRDYEILTTYYILILSGSTTGLRKMFELLLSQTEVVFSD